jgi:hypothetical protein
MSLSHFSFWAFVLRGRRRYEWIKVSPRPWITFSLRLWSKLSSDEKQGTSSTPTSNTVPSAVYVCSKSFSTSSKRKLPWARWNVKSDLSWSPSRLRCDFSCRVESYLVFSLYRVQSLMVTHFYCFNRFLLDATLKHAVLARSLFSSWWQWPKGFSWLIERNLCALH